MAEYAGVFNDLYTEPCGKGYLALQVKDGKATFGRVALAKEQVRALRDELTSYLGDEEKPATLPVGTIVTGKGLTEAQKKNLPDLQTLETIRSALARNIDKFVWGETEEGFAFWRSVFIRMSDLCGETNAEKNRQKRAIPNPVAVGSHHVATDTLNGIRLYCDPYGAEYMSASAARTLAEGLISHADAAEKRDATSGAVALLSTNVAPFTVSSGAFPSGEGVLIGHAGYSDKLSPDQARQLANALNNHADAAEKRGS